MTVCIAAASDNGEYMVTATDGLLSAGDVTGESLIAKMLWMGDWQFMYAGLPAYFSLINEEMENICLDDPGQLGFVGGSMGEISVIIRGMESEFGKQTLYSTIHGAGRVMGRMEATGKIDRKTGEVKRVGKVTQDMMDNWVQSTGVELRGAGLDESPHCYKRLPEVLEAHAGTIEVLHTLTPIGVAMAGKDVFDPFKD